jgi:hypothetical protein
MLLDDEVDAFAAEQSQSIANEFGLAVVTAPPQLEWGDEPEFRPITADGDPRIFVKRCGADWWRIRYQIAHELFHWLCTPAGVFHWTHEQLAVETAVQSMEAIGEHDYARRETKRLTSEAARLPLSTMLVTPFREVYPPGLYGRAWVTGRELIGAVGWKRVKPLAQSFDHHGKPDVADWVAALAQTERSAVEGVLGRPSAQWV